MPRCIFVTLLKALRLPALFDDFTLVGPKHSIIPLDRFQIEELVQRLDKDKTGMIDYRGLADTRKQMMRDYRRQLRREESRLKKEKHKSERVLKTFQSAVEMLSPHSSAVLSPGQKVQVEETSVSAPHFSTTPLSSWHHVMMTNSSRYSVPTMSQEAAQHLLSFSEQYSTSHMGLLASEIEDKYDSEPHASSQPQMSSQQPIMAYDEEAHLKSQPNINSAVHKGRNKSKNSIRRKFAKTSSTPKKLNPKNKVTKP
ncbi:uncharacterized protein LOC122803792 [Protopterus annectens]|uniref:uncharacterized protein LOC122803792 n=1 Tax=Protopterus annectens TaxID=7888 RepID=UPI001CF9E86D|nr:uncharacterized protein LOC122803792 [Protopterus annectens]